MDKPVVLLVISPSQAWFDAISKVASELGVTAISREEETPTASCNLIFVDASLTSDILSFVGRIRQRYPNAYVAVFAADPSWREARDVLLGGASDYLDKSFREGEIRSTILRILQRFHSQPDLRPAEIKKGNENGG